MNALLVLFAITTVGVSAMPDFNNKLHLLRPQWQQQDQQSPQQVQQPELMQQQQPQQLQWEQWHQIKLQAHQTPPIWTWSPQYPQYTTVKTEKVPVVDPRCPRVDDQEKVILLPARGDCHKFLMCHAGYAFEMECPAGLEFAVFLDRCDYPNIAKCSSGW